jgi:hypothetical protein
VTPNRLANLILAATSVGAVLLSGLAIVVIATLICLLAAAHLTA